MFKSIFVWFFCVLYVQEFVVFGFFFSFYAISSSCLDLFKDCFPAYTYSLFLYYLLFLLYLWLFFPSPPSPCLWSLLPFLITQSLFSCTLCKLAHSCLIFFSQVCVNWRLSKIEEIMFSDAVLIIGHLTKCMTALMILFWQDQLNCFWMRQLITTVFRYLWLS